MLAPDPFSGGLRGRSLCGLSWWALRKEQKSLPPHERCISKLCWCYLRPWGCMYLLDLTVLPRAFLHMFILSLKLYTILRLSWE